MNRGRPRIFVTPAERQKAYRERQKAEKQYQERIETLRNSDPEIRYGWQFVNSVSPGTCCMYCSLTVRWSLHGGCSKYYRNHYEWALTYPRYHFIEIRHVEPAWLQCRVGNVCPQCQEGRSEKDHDRYVAILFFEGHPPLPPISPFRPEQWERAIAVGLEELE